MVVSPYSEPVDGGVLSFTSPNTGPAAVLSSTTVTIGAGGQATVSALANGTVGGYGVTASAAGAASPGSFTLSNLDTPVLSGLTDQEITYGTPSLTLSGTIAAGSLVPAGDLIAISLDGVTQNASIGNDGSFLTTFHTVALGVTGSPYTVSYAFAAQAFFVGTDGTSRLTVTPAEPTITAASTSKTYGKVLIFAGTEFQASGLVNGDAVTGVSLASAGASAGAHATAGSRHSLAGRLQRCPPGEGKLVQPSAPVGRAFLTRGSRPRDEPARLVYTKSSVATLRSRQPSPAQILCSGPSGFGPAERGVHQESSIRCVHKGSARISTGRPIVWGQRSGLASSEFPKILPRKPTGRPDPSQNAGLAPMPLDSRKIRAPLLF